MSVPSSISTQPNNNNKGLNWRSATLERQILPKLGSNVIGRNRPVVAIKGCSSSAKIEDKAEGKLLSGDIVEELRTEDFCLVAPFAGGKSGLQKELRRLFNSGQTSIKLKVKRGRDRTAQVEADIVLDDRFKLKRQYVLRLKSDSNYLVSFIDSTEEDCLALQDMRSARLVTQIANTQLRDGYVPYSWEDKILPAIQTSNMVFSFLVLPYTSQQARSVIAPSNDLEDTVARTMTWFSAAQASGVPILFLNIQTEPLLTKVSGQQASSRSVSQGEDLFNIINTNLYGFEDYHGIDIGIVRAVRLWYVASVAELPVVLRWEEGQNKLGLGMKRTNEGFCYISSVDIDSVADKAGLRYLCLVARRAGKLLVVTRVGEERITPSMVSSCGDIRCFDTVSIGQKLSVHRQAGYPVRIHLIAWDEALLASGWGSTNYGKEGSNAEQHQGAWQRGETQIDPFGRQSSTGHNSERHLGLIADYDNNSEAGRESSFSERDSSSSSELNHESRADFSFKLSNLGLSDDHCSL